MHLTTSPIDWYAARAAGVAAYVLLTGVVALGIAMAGRKRFERWPRFALEDVHRFAGILVGAFVAIHVITIAIDAYLPFPLVSLVVPGVASYRPIWTGLGVAAAELLVALAVANRIRDRISYRVWRRSHYLNFVVWAGATLHGLGAGTDSGSRWLVAVDAAAVALVLSLLAWRALRRPRVAPLAGTAGAALALWLPLGPLAVHTHTWNAGAFRDVLSGRVVRDLGASRGLVSLVGTGEGRQRVLVRADLLIEPAKLDATSFQMEFLPSGLRCAGRVTHVQAYGFDGVCRAADGTQRVVAARWNVGSGAMFTDGRLTVHA